MIEMLHRHVIPAAYDLLPPVMASDRATAMLLTIGLQESRFEHRTQIGGPARGFYQFERSGGVAGVLAHPRSRPHIEAAIDALCYRASGDECYHAIAHNDVLATCFARCLLWTLLGVLPRQDDPNYAWRYYLEGWRPGRPHFETWHAHYAEAWAIVAGT